MASPRSLGHRVKHPHLVHHGKNPIHPLLWCVLLLGKLHCVSLQQQDRTRSDTHCALPVSPGKDCPHTPHIRTGCKGTRTTLSNQIQTLPWPRWP